MITPIYSPAPDRYENGMKYRRCGKSGILLPEISLALIPQHYYKIFFLST